MLHPEPLPHDLPLQLDEDLFVVHGCVQPSAIARFTRNMAIVRQRDELTLINPVRMDEPGLAALRELGAIRHVLRLGPLHGMDDAFYTETFGAQFWSFTGGTRYTAPKIDQVLTEGGPLPFARGHLFAFRYMKEPEGAIVLDRAPGNVLLTCDAIQSYATPPHTPHTNVFTRLVMPFIGFPKKTLIGPAWMKMLVEDKAGMQREFERLLALDFDRLLSAHGTFVAADARADVQRAFDEMFG